MALDVHQATTLVSVRAGHSPVADVSLRLGIRGGGVSWRPLLRSIEGDVPQVAELDGTLRKPSAGIRRASSGVLHSVGPTSACHARSASPTANLGGQHTVETRATEQLQNDLHS